MSGAERDAQEYLFGRLEQLHWAVPASLVEQVVAETDWLGGDPTELSTVLGLAAPDEPGWRVLLLRAGPRRVALRARGALGIRSVRADQVLALPPELQAGHGAFTGIVLADEALPLLVVDPAQLAARAAALEGEVSA